MEKIVINFQKLFDKVRYLGQNRFDPQEPRKDFTDYWESQKHSQFPGYIVCINFTKPLVGEFWAVKVTELKQ